MSQLLRLTHLTIVATLFAILFTAVGCGRSEADSNFNVDAWHGRTLDGQPFSLAQISAAPGVVVNFYSPTCAVCIDELPAVAVFYKEAQQLGIPMYMVLEGRPDSHGLDLPFPATFDEVHKVIAERMVRDVERYNISLPVVILHPDFQESPITGLVTGTPETLFFETAPLRLVYNLIGQIAVSHSEEDLKSDTRFQFALSKLRSLNQQL